MMNINFCMLVIITASFFSTTSGFIFSIRCFKSNNVGNIFLAADDHYLGSQHDNHEQLNWFLKYVSSQRGKPLHVVIESQFFSDIPQGEMSFAGFNKFINNRFDTDIEYTFEQSPQDSEAPTWIAWELPFILSSINDKEFDQTIPDEFVLTDQEKKIIINHVTFDYCDPRYSQDALQCAEENFQSSLSDCKNKEAIAQELNDIYDKGLHAKIDPLERQIAQAKIDPFGTEECDIFIEQTQQEIDQLKNYFYGMKCADMGFISALIKKIKDPLSPNMNIIFLCGYAHVQVLSKILPLLECEYIGSCGVAECQRTQAPLEKLYQLTSIINFQKNKLACCS